MLFPYFAYKVIFSELEINSQCNKVLEYLYCEVPEFAVSDLGFNLAIRP